VWDYEFGESLARAKGQFISRRKYPMKKLLTLLFSAVLVFSMAMPVFAQDAAPADKTASKPKKEKKAKKPKKAKKTKDTSADAPK
jgi:hypothetical protein